jgi:four helix bundle protein
MPDIRKLRVWQRAHDFALRIAEIARRIRRKDPDLAKQLRRAADAVPAAIAEGRGRSTDADFARCVSNAIGEITEAESHLQRAWDDALIDANEWDRETREVIAIRGMLIGLRKTLRGQPRPNPEPKPQPQPGPEPEPPASAVQSP